MEQRSKKILYFTIVTTSPCYVIGAKGQRDYKSNSDHRFTKLRAGSLRLPYH